MRNDNHEAAYELTKLLIITIGLFLFLLAMLMDSDAHAEFKKEFRPIVYSPTFVTLAQAKKKAR